MVSHKKKREVVDISQKLWQMQTTQMILRFLQIHSLLHILEQTKRKSSLQF